jgi:hypothetical protein
VVSTTPQPLYPRERPGTHCTGGWVGHRADLGVCENSRPSEIRFPDRPARSQSLDRTISTETYKGKGHPRTGHEALE